MGYIVKVCQIANINLFRGNLMWLDGEYYQDYLTVSENENVQSVLLSKYNFENMTKITETNDYVLYELN